jgi:hypothetical protein
LGIKKLTKYLKEDSGVRTELVSEKRIYGGGGEVRIELTDEKKIDQGGGGRTELGSEGRDTGRCLKKIVRVS